MSVRSLIYSALVFFFFGIDVIHATTFIPVSVVNQLKESQAVVHGTYKGQVYKKTEDEGVITVSYFSVIQMAGIKHNEMINRNELAVTYPGGVWQHLIYSVHGAPKFKEGDEVVLLLNKSGQGLRLHNLSLGKYNVVSKEGVSKIVSSVFPGHPLYGEMTMDKFDNLVFQEIGERMRPLTEDKKVVVDDSKNTKRYWVKKKNISRAISSEPEVKSELETSSGFFLWPIFVLGLLAIAAAILVKRNG